MLIAYPPFPSKLPTRTDHFRVTSYQQQLIIDKTERSPSFLQEVSMYSYWTIAALLLGTALLIPIIMGFFGGNKFPVEGKVNSLVLMKYRS
jgi:hypothetical protein